MGRLILLLVYGSNTEYILHGISDKENVVIDYAFKPVPFLPRKGILGKLNSALSVFLPIASLRMSGRLRKGDRIVFFNLQYRLMYRLLNKTLLRGVRRYIYYFDSWNLISTVSGDSLKRAGYEVFTFDWNDARNQGVHFCEQYFRFPHPKYKSVPIVNDFFFCGMAKGREPQVRILRRVLEANGFTCDFFVPYSISEYITNAEYRRRLCQSRCLIDITQKKQQGLTRRPLEALFYEKKLITDNPHIKAVDFYNENNIFLLDYDYSISIREIIEFMNKPYIEIPKKIKMKYDVNEWIKLFQ